jgi:anti-anti-sigma regulatory factor
LVSVLLLIKVKRKTGLSDNKKTVLKITTIQTEGRRKLVLEGKLIEPWVAEFKRAWQEANESPNGSTLVIDLGDVTVISSQAEKVLLEIRREGGQFVCGGILNKHLVRQIDRKCRQP